ncbi:membrane protein [Knoellia flava TL1]|uniref:Membrane protein n=2 Tax=Knoellia flava TaxID=913969 RepID=A0A8H9KT51_9MICO|nr:MMPL family transporter [Knoellia flava]KGN28789.1 membrane protein [Knoellia flava TL1]GGB85563.1 membrane protein [Knoellia flava]
MRAFSALVTRRWVAGIVALLALLGAGAVIGVVGQAERGPTANVMLPLGSDSRAAAELRDQLPEDQGSAAVVLFSSDSALNQEQLGAVQRIARGLPGATGAPPVVADDGTAAIVVVPVAAQDNNENIDVVADLRTAAKADLPDGVTAQVTGPSAIQADLGAVFDGANFRLLAATASVVALLLIVTYRSPVLWLVPLTVVGVADQLAATLATRTLAAFDVQWDESTIGILSVLVFGAGTDYALLLISRYRDELRVIEDRREAMAHALARTSEAVLSSATTVVLGLLTLLLSVFPTTRGLGLACAVGVVVAAGFVLVVLPAALVVFGRWIFWPKVPRTGQASLADSRSLWRRVGDAVSRHPARFAGVTVVLLALAAAGLTQIRTGLDGPDQFLEKPEAIAAGERLAESFPAGSADPVIVVSRGVEASTLDSTVKGVEGVASTRVVASAGGVSEVQAVLESDPGSDAAEQSVRDIRAAVADLGETHVGGTDAEAIDESESTSRDRVLIFPLILGLVLLALGALLRSVVAPVVLVGTVVATYLASLGISWVLFTQVFGFERLDNSVPLFAFVFLVALGVDYNIFLVTRAAEEGRTHGPREGMLRALAATGGVITSAGILLAAVFAVLGVLPLVVLAQLGVVICVGVLLDTLVVRTVLVPAIALVLGHRFWWPRRVGEAPARSEQRDASGEPDLALAER